MSSETVAAGAQAAQVAQAGFRHRLGELLLAEGLITEAELEQAIAEQRQTGERLGATLVDLGVVSSVDMTRVLARHFDVGFVDLDELQIDPSVRNLITEAVARTNGALPIGWEGDRLVVAFADPSDVFAVDDIRILTKALLKRVMAERGQLERAIDRVLSDAEIEHNLEAAEADAPEREESGPATPTSKLLVEADDGPIVKFVQGLLTRAIEESASDVHVEPSGSGLRIRFRIDGVLHDVMEAAQSIQAGVLSRLKIMSGMDITVRRLPQDGRVTMTVGGRPIDLRVITIPVSDGEAMVLRILNHDHGLLQLDALGFLPEARARFEAVYRQAWGTIVVTGPTGSGKSTTLYATVNELNQPGVGIVTIEDPVEYRINGIKQMQVNRRVGFDFPDALRSMLRADPDVLLVGEVRDRDTAAVAAEAALTGHLVLTTLHTPDAASTPIRLVEMGLEPFLVSAALDCIVAQRLTRRLCMECREPWRPSLDELERAGWPEALLPDDGAAPMLYRAGGCGICNDTGYRGRLALHEVMPVSEEIDHLIVARAPSKEIERVAVAEGMLTLRDCGFRKVADGITTLEELFRVSV